MSDLFAQLQSRLDVSTLNPVIQDCLRQTMGLLAELSAEPLTAASTVPVLFSPLPIPAVVEEVVPLPPHPPITPPPVAILTKAPSTPATLPAVPSLPPVLTVVPTEVVPPLVQPSLLSSPIGPVVYSPSSGTSLFIFLFKSLY